MSPRARRRTLPYRDRLSPGPTSTGRRAPSRAAPLRCARSVLHGRWGTCAAASAGLAVVALFSLAFVGATAAAADSTPGSSSPPPSGSSGTSGSGASGPASSSSLGGFQTQAAGSGITWSYEQPNFPVPATPTFELNLGYSQTSYNAGPTGESLASTLWPGQVAANALSQLGILLQPYFGNSTPNLAVPPWPVQASSAYPPGPSTPSSASQDSPGVTMEANSTQEAGTATSTFGSSNGNGNSYALPSGFISVQSIGSTVQSTVTNSQAVSQGTSEVHGVSIAGGLITIGQVTSTATATSDGNQGKETGTSTASQVSVAGQSVTLDSSGLHAAGHDVGTSSELSIVQRALQTAGVSLTLTNPTDTTAGASATRRLDGVQIRIDLTTLDKQINQLIATLPQQVQTQVIDQLPLPPPNGQILTVDLGWVNVQSAASPGYNTDLSSPNAADQGAGGTSGPAGTAGGAGGASGFGAGGAGVAGSGGAGRGGGGLPTASTAPAKFFRGVGAGLIVLGALLALGLAGVLWRADKAVGALTAGEVCAGEDR